MITRWAVSQSDQGSAERVAWLPLDGVRCLARGPAALEAALQRSLDAIPGRRRDRYLTAGGSERQRLRRALERAALEPGRHRARRREAAARLLERDRVEGRVR